MKNKIALIIPVRMGSSRFPGKPLKKILNKSMVMTIYENVKNNPLTNHIYVATCDKKIKEHCEDKNVNVIMTRKSHVRASERCVEAMHKIEKKKNFKFQYILMLQGDEPLIESSLIKKIIYEMLKNKKDQVFNLVNFINNKKDLLDKNCVKVVENNLGNAMFFSRSAIPHLYKFKKNYFLKQTGLIGFSRKAILEFIKLKPSKNEKYESVDMLRFLDNGINIKVIKTKKETFAVDTKKDLLRIKKILKKK